MNKTTNVKLLTIKYCIIQAVFWGLICVICGGYPTIFLMDRGFSEMQVGIIVSLGSIGGVVFQPIFAAIADDARKMTLHSIIIMLSVISIGCLVGLYFIKSMLLAIAALFVIVYAICQTLIPLTNSISVYYVNRGLNVNFGLARGMGSAFYAILSLVMGKLIETYDCGLLVLTGIMLCLIIALVTASFPVLKDMEETKGTEEDNDSKIQNASGTGFGFFKKYKGFVGIMLGAFFIYMFHGLCNSYLIMIVERVGGGKAELGKALSICAIVELPIMISFAFIVKRFKSSTLLIFSAFMFFVKAVGYIVATNMTGLYIAQMTQMFGYGLFTPASVYFVNDLMDEEDAVKGQAYIVAAGTCSGVVSSLAGGAILDRMGVDEMLILQVVCAGLGALLIGLFARGQSKKN